MTEQTLAPVGPTPRLATRRSLLAATALGALGASVLSACAAPGAGTPSEAVNPSGLATKVTFFSPATDKMGDSIMRDQSDKFNNANKNIQIDYVVTVTDDNYKNYTTAMVAGSAPDVIMTYDYPPIPQWQAKGLIRDVDQYRSEMKIKQEDYFANVWQMVIFGGKLYGFLQEFDARLLGINNELAQRANLDPAKPPQTIDEMDNWNSRLIKNEGGALTQAGLVPWRQGGYDLWAGLHGGGYFDPATAKFTINRKENVASLAWMQKTAKLYGSYDNIEAFHKDGSVTDRKSFYSGRIAMFHAGEWDPNNNFSREQPQLTFTIAYWPVVSGVTYGTGQTGGGNTFVLPKDAPHPKEAVTVMKFFASAENVWDWNVRENNLPPVKAVANDPKFREAVPMMAKWLDMIKIDKMRPVLATPLVDYFNTSRSGWATKAIKGEVSPQQALDELQKDMDTQVDLFNKTKTLP